MKPIPRKRKFQLLTLTVPGHVKENHLKKIIMFNTGKDFTLTSRQGTKVTGQLEGGTTIGLDRLRMLDKMGIVLLEPKLPTPRLKPKRKKPNLVRFDLQQRHVSEEELTALIKALTGKHVQIGSTAGTSYLDNGLVGGTKKEFKKMKLLLQPFGISVIIKE